MIMDFYEEIKKKNETFVMKKEQGGTQRI